MRLTFPSWEIMISTRDTETSADSEKPQMGGCSVDNFCDLHTHSTFSDGTFTPSQIVAEALRANLRSVALTDHNTVAGLPEFLEAARGTALEAIPGV